MVKKSKIFITIFSLIFFCNQIAFCDVITGQVNQNETLKRKNKVVDSYTQKPVTGAAISIPSIGYRTTSGSDGTFELNTQINQTAILSVQKDGYRPFSLTIDDNIASKPLKLGIEKSKMVDVTI